MSYQRRVVHFGSDPANTPTELSDRAVAGCWFEIHRQGGCGAGELLLRDGFPDRADVDIGDWIGFEHSPGDRWYLGRVEYRQARSPSGVSIRLEGMSVELGEVFPGGFSRDADGVPPHRYAATDLFPFDPDYDPSARFHRSTYLDPSITKFVHRRRAMDIVPETTVKVCDCPNTVFFDRDGRRGYAEFLDMRHPGIVDWGDSMVQAIDILYRLGFRTIYLAGCEMRVQPSAHQQQLAERNGVAYDAKGLFGDFLAECEQAGLTAEQLEELDPARTYHFDEVKPIRAAATTDQHYFRVAQWLRLSRRNMALVGLQLISATPNSRLNDYFPHETVERIIDEIHHTVGNPRTEPTRGLYTKTDLRQPPSFGPMRDYQPHNWSKQSPPPPAPTIVAVPVDAPTQTPAQQKLQQLRNADEPCENG